MQYQEVQVGYRNFFSIFIPQTYPSLISIDLAIFIEA